MLNIFKTSSIGIDVTDSSLRLVMLSRKGKKITLEYFNEVSLPEGIVVEGEIKEPEKFSENLTKLFKGSGKGKKSSNIDIISSIPPKNTFTVLMEETDEIKNAKKEKRVKKIPEAILSKIKERIPIPAEEIYIDWQANAQDKILVSAAPKQVVDNYTSSFKYCEKFLSAIDVKAASIIRSVTSAKNSENKLIIHLGELSSVMILGGNNSIEFTMNIPFSDKLINDLIESKLNLSKLKIKKAKKACGLSDKKCHGALKKILEPHLNEVVGNIKNILVYHKENFKGDKPIDKIILCGQGANLKEIDKLLKQKTKIETIIGNPLININSVNKDLDSKDSLKFTAAIGMALRGVL